RQPPLREEVPQRGSFDVFHRDERSIIVVADLVDFADERMIEAGGRLRFACQPPAGAFVGRLGRRQEFQCGLAIEREILREVDLAHAALPDAREDLIVRDLGPDHARLLFSRAPSYVRGMANARWPVWEPVEG